MGALSPWRGPSFKIRETPLLTTACVLRPGETLRSQRVVDRVGPVAIVGLHALWEASAVMSGSEGPLADVARRYREEYVEKTGTPADRAYLTVHEGHLVQGIQQV